MKKFLSVLLCLVMMMVFMPAGAWAEDGGENAAPMVKVKYKAAAVNKIQDFMQVQGEVLQTGKITMSSPLPVMSKKDGVVTAQSEWLDAGNTNLWIAIDLKDGYKVKDIRINGTKSAYWFGCDDDFYALYDKAGKKIDVSSKFNTCGYIGGELEDGTVNTLAWTSHNYFGYDPDTKEKLTDTKEDKQYYADSMEEIKNCSSKYKKVGSVVTYYIRVADPSAVKYVEIVTEKTPDKDALIQAVKNSKPQAKSQLVTTNAGKKGVKVTWTTDSDVKYDGYEVYRATTKDGFGKKPIFKTAKKSYTNTSVKAGKRYYYRVRGYVEIDGVKVYSKYSNKVYRTIK